MQLATYERYLHKSFLITTVKERLQPATDWQRTTKIKPVQFFWLTMFRFIAPRVVVVWSLTGHWSHAGQTTGRSIEACTVVQLVHKLMYKPIAKVMEMGKFRRPGGGAQKLLNGFRWNLEYIYITTSGGVTIHANPCGAAITWVVSANAWLAVWPSWPFQPLKFRTFENPRWPRLFSWKIEKSPYLSNGLTDRYEIWYDAYWPSW